MRDDDDQTSELELASVGDRRVLLSVPPELDPSADRAAGDLVIALLAGEVSGPPPEALALLLDAPTPVREGMLELLAGGDLPPPFTSD